jgi:hypothetical protein
MIFLRAYTVTSLSFSKVIDICRRVLLRGAGLPLQKANRYLGI